MKAIRIHHRGGADDLLYEDAPLPVPAAGQVRIRVAAAALTPPELTWDQTYQHPDGSPRLPSIPGHDVAGTIDALGPGVSSFAPGDSVFALIDFPFDGSFAEFVIAPGDTVARAPRSLDPIHAAALPLSALTAWQALFEHGNLQPGQRVLIHAGAGGVGAYAVQLAAWKKAHVISTASTKKIADVKALGANEVIDYTTQRFADVAKNIDLVLDTVGGQTLTDSFTTLRPGGRLITIAGQPDQTRAAAAHITAKFFIVRPNAAQLTEIAALADAKLLTPRIEQIFLLSQTRDAFHRAAAGHLTGKLILTVP